MYRFVSLLSQTVHKTTAFLTISGISGNYWYKKHRNLLIKPNIDWKSVSYVRSARMNGDNSFTIDEIYSNYQFKLVTVTNYYRIRTTKRSQRYTGTGMYIRLPNDDRLYVLTNYHLVGGHKIRVKSFVVRDADNYVPSKTRPKTYGRVVYMEPHLDLALLLIKDEPLDAIAVEFVSGKSGEPVVSIGNPEIKYSLAYGDITCADRPKWTDDGPLSEWSDRDFDLVLHTSTISPGFSGGPLINMRGEVVGVNRGGWWPIGDPIRQNQALTVKSTNEFLENAINWRKYEYSFDGRKCLGVIVQELDIRLILEVQELLKGLKGALLVRTTMPTKQPLPQDQKLCANDIIVKVGGNEVNCVNVLNEIEWSDEKAIDISVVRYNSSTKSQESKVLKVKPQESSAYYI